MMPAWRAGMRGGVGILFILSAVAWVAHVFPDYPGDHSGWTHVSSLGGLALLWLVLAPPPPSERNHWQC